MYHEQQVLSLCLKHTLNNLLQEPHFSKEDLDRVAEQLAPGRFKLSNPHKKAFFGDYDVNVMMAVLQQLGKEARWHDERDSEFQDVGLEGCWALVVNVKASRRWRPMTSGRHWYGMKMINGDWWVLDSVLPFPQQLTEGLDRAVATAVVREHLRQQRAEDETMHLFVISPETARNADD